MKKYETVIGLEVHVELSTKSKIFCGCKAEFGGEINTHICPVCVGMPGTLPVLNKQVVEYAIKLGLASNCKISNNIRFDRKNYFYPDNPQNYQISQLYRPICTEGYIDIGNKDKEGISKSDDGLKRIRIHEMHMEEDAGKIVHDEARGLSLIDYNRSGVPLIEIVTEPDMSSSEEVIAFLEKLKDIIKYLDISDCKLNEGSMRVDVNLSVKEENCDILGTRTEMKNLNSFKAISRAIVDETKRQIELLEQGKDVIQETRRWDDNAGCSFSMRNKEDSNDYRYFPEPDISPIAISEQWIENIKNNIPELREEKIKRYISEFSLSDYDSEVLTSDKNIARFYENIVYIMAENINMPIKPKKIANWIMVDVFKIMNDKDIEPEKLPIDAFMMAQLIELVESKEITKTSGIEVLNHMFDGKINENTDIRTYVEKIGLLIVEDEEELNKVIDTIFANNPKSIEDYCNGKTKAMGFLIGQTMKAMKGKASPEKVNEIIKSKLSNIK